jgi:hypothetical protein
MIAVGRAFTCTGWFPQSTHFPQQPGHLSTGQKIEGLEKPVDMEFQIEKGFGQEI